ncbi:MAG: hypothetical protein ACLT33_00320 [Lachnospira pectinoschiza]
MEADVIGKMSKETFDRIVQGRITFHRAFMTGDMTAKGNFRTLRMLDEYLILKIKSENCSYYIIIGYDIPVDAA